MGNPCDPLVLVWHSRGAAVARWLAWKLKKELPCLRIKLLVAIDEYWFPNLWDLFAGTNALPGGMHDTHSLNGEKHDITPSNVEEEWEFRSDPREAGIFSPNDYEEDVGEKGSHTKIASLVVPGASHTEVDDVVINDEMILKKIFRKIGE